MPNTYIVVKNRKKYLSIGVFLKKSTLLRIVLKLNQLIVCQYFSIKIFKLAHDILKMGMPNNLPTTINWKVLLYLVRYSFYAISWKVVLLFNRA